MHMEALSLREAYGMAHIPERQQSFKTEDWISINEMLNGHDEVVL